MAWQRYVLATFLGAVFVFSAGEAAARVVAITIESRLPFANSREFGTAGAYEIISGRLSYTVDPKAAANRRIVDLHLAPRDGSGKVSFAGDFILLKPVATARGNRRLLMEVTNRGGLALLGFFNFGRFNNNPRTLADAGDGFLLAQGYSLLWTAWNWDVRAGAGRLQIDLPIAVQNGEPVQGRVVAEMVPTYPTDTMPLAWGHSRGYPPVLSDLASARLTVRRFQNAPRRAIPKSDWALAGRGIVLSSGFEPGQIYEFNYLASGAKIVGLGLAALRDAASFFRYRDDAANPLSGALDFMIAFGHSQSGRVLQHMLWQGFHIDEAGRALFDGMFLNAPGGGKGSFNHRFAQTTRHPSQHEDHQYPADFFPFATVPQTDPVRGKSGDLLARARTGPAMAKIFYTQTSTDYWTRSASLLHANVAGTRDLPIDASARIYVFAGAQHFVGVPRQRGRFALCHNPADYRYFLRALLLRLDAWMSGQGAPPASVRPTISGGSLGPLAQYRRRFPVLPGPGGALQTPKYHLRPPRLDLGPRFAEIGIIGRHPPLFGPAFETLLPLPDKDGIDTGGIRLPQISAPLGTYLGWNHRRDGAIDAIGRWSGSYIPFAASRRGNDSRLSVKERYVDRADYLRKVKTAAASLVQQGYILADDLPAILHAATRRYDAQMRQQPGDRDCAYLQQ